MEKDLIKYIDRQTDIDIDIQLNHFAAYLKHSTINQLYFNFFKKNLLKDKSLCKAQDINNKPLWILVYTQIGIEGQLESIIQDSK